jgi:hypothetical protein
LKSHCENFGVCLAMRALILRVNLRISQTANPFGNFSQRA